jgi:hypothetical protein
MDAIDKPISESKLPIDFRLPLSERAHQAYPTPAQSSRP